MEQRFAEYIGYVFYFIQGVWLIITDNIILAIPVAMFVLYYTLDILKKLFNILKKGG